MRINLKVPYEQKERAKKLGAKWDKARKVWYIEYIDDLLPFEEWLPFYVPKKVKQVLVRSTTHSTHNKITSC